MSPPEPMQAALTEARMLQRRLFPDGALHAAFSLQPDHPRRTDDAPAVARSYARIHGQEIDYDMGGYRPWTQVTWPGTPGAVLRVTTQSGELEPIRAEGDWAWLRLLERATVHRHGPATHVVAWPMTKGVTLRYLLRVSDDLRFLDDPTRLFAFSCPRLPSGGPAAPPHAGL